ncbi:MAG: metallophosphoesterase [Gemmataceae bacterium]|nr:metallophosphoesterase [Gemmataceae bacterium]MCI0743429.1 metallophosphoesterase [Gemmataceae bacterium]
MPRRDYQGLLFIGDPHLASRVPGFRKDDYARVILEKLSWCLRYARDHNLLPALLGDLFHFPRDNANWLLGELLALLGDHEVLAVYGNHDTPTNELGDDDTFAVLVKAGRLRLLDRDGPWRGDINGRAVVVGGTSWGRPLPEQFGFETEFRGSAFPNRVWERGEGARGASAPALVFWLAHHDVLLPGYDLGRFSPFSIPGIDIVVNGHIHRPLDDVRAGNTWWWTPGNISRITRSDIARRHMPAVLRVDIVAEAPGWRKESIGVPHEPFDAVFHEQLVEEPVSDSQSAFVQGLAELQARRTGSGAGLMEFVEANLWQFDADVAERVRDLAKEVAEHGQI